MRARRKAGTDRIAELLRSRGVALTRQRIEIARVLFEQREHLSADQILQRVNKRHPEASKATIYNTLRLLVSKKLLRELVIDSAKSIYDPNMAPHHHLYDVETGQLSDISADGVQVIGLPPLPAGTFAEGVDIVVRVRRRV